MSGERVFVDTDVLVYSYDRNAGGKRHAASSALIGRWNSQTGSLSTQVLQEFYVTVTRKLRTPMAGHVARDIIDTYRAWPVHRPDVDDVMAATVLGEQQQLSFWDALIVVSAQRSHAHALLSEDLSDGRRFGDLVIANPLGASSAGR